MKRIFFMLTAIGFMYVSQAEANVSAVDSQQIKMDIEHQKENERMEAKRIKIQNERIKRIKASEGTIREGEVPTLKDAVVISEEEAE